MRRGLVRDRIGLHAPPHQLGQHLGGVAEHADRYRFPLAAGALHHRQCLVEILRLGVEIAGLEPHLDARGLAFDRQQRGTRHGGGERLRAAHAAEAGGEDPLAGEAAAVVAPQQLGKGLVGALHDALRADIDPGAGGHLAVHHQALAIERVEMVERRPVRDQVRVRDQHARRVRVRAKHADGLSRLHAQGLVRLEIAQGCDHAIEALPIARGAARAAVDHQLVRVLRHLGIEIVHQHAQRRLGQPALGRQFGPRGARMMRVLSRRVGIGSLISGTTRSPSPARKGEAVLEHGAQCPLDRLGELRVPRRRIALVGEDSRASPAPSARHGCPRRVARRCG